MDGRRHSARARDAGAAGATPRRRRGDLHRRPVRLPVRLGAGRVRIGGRAVRPPTGEAAGRAVRVPGGQSRPSLRRRSGRRATPARAAHRQGARRASGRVAAPGLLPPILDLTPRRRRGRHPLSGLHVRGSAVHARALPRLLRPPQRRGRRTAPGAGAVGDLGRRRRAPPTVAGLRGDDHAPHEPALHDRPAAERHAGAAPGVRGLPGARARRPHRRGADQGDGGADPLGRRPDARSPGRVQPARGGGDDGRVQGRAHPRGGAAPADRRSDRRRIGELRDGSGRRPSDPAGRRSTRSRRSS